MMLCSKLHCQKFFKLKLCSYKIRHILPVVQHITLQGYLAHKKQPPPQEPTVALCRGIYGDPRGVGVSYERGTPVAPSP